MTDSTIFTDIRKSDGERLRVSVKTYAGREYVDLRHWYRNDSGLWCASAKGLSLNPSLIPEIIRGLTLAASAVDPHGVR
jgi:Transcriptional Coactivator p15 (PC4)